MGIRMFFDADGGIRFAERDLFVYGFIFWLERELLGEGGKGKGGKGGKDSEGGKGRLKGG